MFYFFISSKIFLTIVASYLIYQVNPWLVPIFILFIAIDLIDSRVMGLDYRPYDSFFDRTFAYVCFFSFLIFSSAIYPAIVYIAAFAVRDFVVAGVIQKTKNYTVKSNIFDRTTMLVVALFFAVQAGGLFTESNIGIDITCFFLAGLILYQAVDKSRRVRNAKPITV